jgi:UDP-N-acetylglucosamine 2-epimerase (non-hydrolysing)
MRPGQSLTDVTTRVLTGLEPVFRRERPDAVLVHGDTTTTLARRPGGPLPTDPRRARGGGAPVRGPAQPVPRGDEPPVDRRPRALAFRPHAPGPASTCCAKASTVGGCSSRATPASTPLRWALRRLGATAPKLPPVVARRAEGPFVLVTAHRRENFGEPLEQIFLAIRDVARARPALGFVYPVHPNPNVAEPARRILGREPNIALTAPFDYAPMIHLMRRCLFVLTDSGGLQEEAPSLGKPVLVLRTVTERPEGIKAGTARLAGVDRAGVRRSVYDLLDDRRLYQRMARTVNPYGDGRASRRIVEVLG